MSPTEYEPYELFDEGLGSPVVVGIVTEEKPARVDNVESSLLCICGA
jgi:hypothetical protein